MLEFGLKDLVGRILPLCNDYVHLSLFVEKYSNYEFGLIHHAFCSAINSFLKVIFLKKKPLFRILIPSFKQDYLILIAQLENQFNQGQLNLQVKYFF